MFRLFCKKILTTTSRRMYSHISNPPKSWSKELISSNLRIFLNQYFHPYQFFVSMNSSSSQPLKNFSSILFDVTHVEKNHGQFKKSFEYKVTPNFDPAIKLLNQITKKDTLDIRFKIYPIGNGYLHVFLPGNFLPTHFSLRIRDEIEENKIRTLTNLSDLQNNKNALLTKDPFKFELDLNQISTLEIPEHDKVECMGLLREYELQREANINTIMDYWNNLNEKEQSNILNMFYNDYYKLYIENPTNPSTNTIRFYVHDKNWDLGNALRYTRLGGLNNPANDTNTAVTLMKLSQYRHSSVHGYYPNDTSGGAISVNAYCPGIYFLKSIDYLETSDIGNSPDVAMRHGHFNADKTEKYSDMLYPYNGFIPYWMIIYLKESCDAMGLKTSELTLPEEMRVTQRNICRP